MKLPTTVLSKFTTILGIWLFLSPFVFDLYTSGVMTTVVWHSFFMGVVLIAVSIVAVYHQHLWEEVIYLMIGFWLVASPFVLGFTGEKIAMMNHILIGVFIGIDAIVVILQSPG